MTPDEIVAEAQANVVKAEREIAKRCATGDACEIDGLFTDRTGTPATPRMHAARTCQLDVRCWYRQPIDTSVECDVLSTYLDLAMDRQ